MLRLRSYSAAISALVVHSSRGSGWARLRNWFYDANNEVGKIAGIDLPLSLPSEFVMLAEITEKSTELEQMCREHHVRRLDLFGSAATGEFDAQKSDLDFLVEFMDVPGAHTFKNRYRLSRKLESLFGRPIDLVVDRAIRNPYFRQSVEESRTPVYASLREETSV